ncbi:MAG: serine hydrolase [Thermoanaerobaculia bacterium]
MEEIFKNLPSPGYISGFGSLKNNLSIFFRGYSLTYPRKIKVKKDTIFDLASLTKPLITSNLFRILKIDLKEKFDLKNLEKFPLGNPKLIDLLNHRSGLPSWYPLPLLSSNPEEAVLKIPSLQYTKPGTKTEYSCLGYILLGKWLEENFNKNLSEITYEYIIKPNELEKEVFFPFKGQVNKLKVAGTELGNKIEREKSNFKIKKRKSPIWGEVHDGNAYFLGGCAGNAGLFGTIEGVFVLAKHSWFDYFEGREGEFFYGFKIGGERTCFPQGCLGHTGFTGTSFCLHINKKKVSILLTNRLHRKKPEDINSFRKKFHNWVENLV